jgi:hypothetical protein
MTLYRLYLRSNIRRERLKFRQIDRATEPVAASPAGTEEHPSVIYGEHRYSYAIVGREELEAENDAAALAIARCIFDAAGDLCGAFELWDGTRQIDQSRMATLQTSMVSARRQEHVIRVEEALLSSGWAIAHSRRLLARCDELRLQATRGELASPAAT